MLRYLFKQVGTFKQSKPCATWRRGTTQKLLPTTFHYAYCQLMERSRLKISSLCRDYQIPLIIKKQAKCTGMKLQAAKNWTQTRIILIALRPFSTMPKNVIYPTKNTICNRLRHPLLLVSRMMFQGLNLQANSRMFVIAKDVRWVKSLETVDPMEVIEHGADALSLVLK